MVDGVKIYLINIDINATRIWDMLILPKQNSL